LASILIIPLLARGVQAQEKLQVKVAGATPAVASHSHSHDITENALRGGSTEYTIISRRTPLGGDQQNTQSEVTPKTATASL
jgi:hypothetical protein